MDSFVADRLRAVDEIVQPVSAAFDFLFIGELSKAVALSTRAIRFYEKEGLIAPARHGRFRVYRRSDVDRVRTIARMRAMGFSVATIGEHLESFIDLPTARNRQEALALLDRHLLALDIRQDEIIQERALTRAFQEELQEREPAGG